MPTIVCVICQTFYYSNIGPTTNNAWFQAYYYLQINVLCTLLYYYLGSNERWERRQSSILLITSLELDIHIYVFEKSLQRSRTDGFVAFLLLLCVVVVAVFVGVVAYIAKHSLLFDFVLKNWVILPVLLMNRIVFHFS